MSTQQEKRGGAPVGFLEELGVVEAGAVHLLRQWSDGKSQRDHLYRRFEQQLGHEWGCATLETFAALCKLCHRYGRRPLMRHHCACRCLGADEACFANFIACAADGDDEDALLIATLLVRADYAHSAAALARDVGLALKRVGALEVVSHPPVEQRLH